MRNCLIVAGSLVLAQAAAAREGREALAAPDTLNGLPLVFQEDFEKGWSRWEVFDEPSFKLTTLAGNSFVQVPQLSDYQPPVRGPFNRLVIKDLQVRDFIIEARVRVTEIGRGHRGGLFIFGYQDPSHLYYTHYAAAQSDRSHIFAKVAGAPRFTFFQTRTSGIPWTMGWQTIRTVRKFREGVIEAYVDDMTKPVLVADDIAYKGTVYLYDEVIAYTNRNIPVTQTDRFEWGRLGIGSFQGILDYDDVKVWAEVKGAPTRAVPPGVHPVDRRSRPGPAVQASARDGRGFLPRVETAGKTFLPDGKRDGKRSLAPESP